MDEKFTRGHALINRYRNIYEQTLFKETYFRFHPNAELIKTTPAEKNMQLKLLASLTANMQKDVAQYQKMRWQNY